MLINVLYDLHKFGHFRKFIRPYEVTLGTFYRAPAGPGQQWSLNIWKFREKFVGIRFAQH